MDRSYDIFEKIDGQDMWRCAVEGHEAAILKLQELAKSSPNEFTVMHMPDLSVVARLKFPTNA